jgi:hypothetical protein
VLNQAAQAAHIGNQFPNLVFIKPTPKRRHSFWASLDDRSENLLWLAAVNPFVIHQGHAHAAATVSVAANAVETAVELLSLAEGIGSFLVTSEHGRICFRTSGMQIAHANHLGGFGLRGRCAKCALLAFARKANQRREDGNDSRSPKSFHTSIRFGGLRYWKLRHVVTCQDFFDIGAAARQNFIQLIF